MRALDLVRPTWPPLHHVERGWNALKPAERRRVEARMETVLARHSWGPHQRDALARFFAFLAQVETIAIEIPLRALPAAGPKQARLLRAQLTDEVFHSAIFAHLAHELALPAAQPPAPIPAAERLLQRIRDEPDAAVAATLLNLVAEAWIETLFRHAKTWGVADAVFDAVLADEQRHVEEAFEHLGTVQGPAAEAAVRALEDGLLDVGADPAVSLALFDLAGAAGYRALADNLESNHTAQLAKVGLTPSPRFAQMRPMREALGSGPRPQPVPDTPWRSAARTVWQEPRNPTMQGSMTLRVGHVPKRLLTPVFVAAVARAWARTPRLNRIVSRGQVVQLPHVNVGVRVLVADDELATVVVPLADTLSVKDIARCIADGHAQLTQQRTLRLEAVREGKPPAPSLAAGLDSLMPSTEVSFSVAVSNPGKFGLEEGAGAFSGPLSPSTDLTLGQRKRMPHWFGLAYLPTWSLPIGCLQDHRVFDGREAGMAMQALREELSPTNVRRLLRAPDRLPPETPIPAWMQAMPAELRALPTVALWKYTPLVVGGTALAAGLGVGGYFLFQNLAANSAAAAAGSGAAASSTAAGGPTSVAGSAASLAHAPGLCQAIIHTGDYCTSPAVGGGFCDLHGGR